MVSASSPSSAPSEYTYDENGVVISQLLTRHPCLHATHYLDRQLVCERSLQATYGVKDCRSLVRTSQLPHKKLTPYSMREHSLDLTCISFEYASSAPHEGHFSDTCVTSILVAKNKAQRRRWGPAHQCALISLIMQLRLSFPLLPQRGRKRVWVRSRRNLGIFVRCPDPRSL